MPRNTEIIGSGLRALAAGDTIRVDARDFGVGVVQFVVGTDQAVGAALAAWLCDPSNSEVAPVHPGPPISFETDSFFVIKNRGVASVNVIYGVLRLNPGAANQPAAGGDAGAAAGGGGGGGGGSGQTAGGGSSSGRRVFAF